MGLFCFPFTLKVGDPEGRDCYLALASPRPTVCPHKQKKKSYSLPPKIICDAWQLTSVPEAGCIFQEPFDRSKHA